jgi:hypothetical protein
LIRRPECGEIIGPALLDAQRLDQTRLGRRQQLREHGEVEAACGAQPEGGAHVDAKDAPARREPQLAVAGEQNIPGLVLLSADQGVLPVGAESPVGSRFASGAGQAAVAAGSTVFGPSTGLEVPAAEGLTRFLRRSAAPGGV